MIINLRKKALVALFFLCMKVKKGYTSLYDSLYGQDNKSKKSTKMDAI